MGRFILASKDRALKFWKLYLSKNKKYIFWKNPEFPGPNEIQAHLVGAPREQGHLGFGEVPAGGHGEVGGPQGHQVAAQQVRQVRGRQARAWT